ncbi:MAG: fumarate hydratase [Caldisericia bacterium]|nr:fumarate hydratase [Caldisericia bacterium]
MKTINCRDITKCVKDMCIEANTTITPDVTKKIEDALNTETHPLAKEIIKQILENIVYSKKTKIPLCQDTGVAIIFAEIGQNAVISGGNISEAIQNGVKQGYKDGYLRNSMVFDPAIKRENTNTNTPAIIYWDVVPGDKLTMHFTPKGGGSENMSRIAMLKPTQGEKGIEEFIIETVKIAGGNPCPPIILGIGIGGSFDRCAYLAKKSLLQNLDKKNEDQKLAAWEEHIKDKCNELGIGPMGLGGLNTVLAVNMLWEPCHIASLPVAVNIQCHCARHQTAVLSGKED